MESEGTELLFDFNLNVHHSFPLTSGKPNKLLLVVEEKSKKKDFPMDGRLSETKTR